VLANFSTTNSTDIFVNACTSKKHNPLGRFLWVFCLKLVKCEPHLGGVEGLLIKAAMSVNLVVLPGVLKLLQYNAVLRISRGGTGIFELGQRGGKAEGIRGKRKLMVVIGLSTEEN